MRKINQNQIVIPTLFLFLFFIIQYFIAKIPGEYNDFRDHALFAREILTGDRPTAGNFLFYWLVNLFSFFSSNIKPSEISLSLLLAFAITFRYYLSQKRLAIVLLSEHSDKKNFWFTSLLAMSLLFVFAIPIVSYLADDFLYIGNYVPNVWHNSTVIFLFPFALILFELAYKQLKEFEKKRNIWIIVLIFLNIFIKPSYFFVFAVVYSVMLLVKYKFKKEFWYSIIPLVFGLCFLILEFWTIYLTANPVDDEKSGVIFQPFYSSPNFDDLWQIPFSLIFSLFFPIVYIISNFSKIKNSLLFWFTSLSFIVSVFIYLFIAETGPRATHGNFYWQIVICTWLCFFVSLMSLMKDFKMQGRTTKNKILFSVYILHVLMGVVYFIWLFITGSYY